MRCDKAQEVFSEYLEGTLEKPMMFMFEHHLENCPMCGRDYEKFCETWGMLGSLPEVEVPAGFRESVMVEIRAQQGAAKRRSWSLDLSSILGARIQVRAVAAAAAVVMFAAMLVQVSPWQVVRNSPTGTDLPKTRRISDQGGVEWRTNDFAVVDPGLSIEVSAATGKRGRLIYGIELKPNNKVPIRAKAYLMNQGQPVFTSKSIQASDVIFDQTLDPEQNGTISVIARENTDTDTVYVTWEYNSTPMSEIIFLPTRLAVADRESFQVSGKTVHEALQKLSMTYGVVVIADAKISGRTGQVDLVSADVENALHNTLKRLPLRWRPLGANVYIVERKL